LSFNALRITSSRFEATTVAITTGDSANLCRPTRRFADVGKTLVLMLIRWAGGEPKLWSVVRVPSDADEDGRQLHREVEELKWVGDHCHQQHLRRLASLHRA
jgi:hypothetical protein